MPAVGVGFIARDDGSKLIKDDFADQIFQDTWGKSLVLQKLRKLDDLPAYRQMIPVLDTLPTASFFTAGAGVNQPDEIAASQMSWDQVWLYIADVGVIIPIPKDLIDDAGYDMDSSIYPAISQALAQTVDKAILHGTSKPALWPNSIYTTAAAAGNVVSLAAFPDPYDAILGEGGLWSKIEADGFMVNGAIAAPSVMATLRAARDANGSPIFWANPTVKGSYSVGGVDTQFDTLAVVASANSGRIFAGDWTKAVFAFRKGLTIDIAKEATINTTAGANPINLFQKNSIAIRAIMRLGWAHPNPINLSEATAANRCNFGVLTA
jgi:HK97 family phage major capsid protein